MAESLWDQLAARLVDALGAQRGELIEVRDEAGNQRLLHAVLLALESIGAEPLVSILPAQHVERLLATAPPEVLAARSQRHAEWLQQVDRSLALIGAQPDLRRAASAAASAFTTAYERLEAIRAKRRIPQVIAAIPTIGKAAQLGLSHEDLELRMMPALLTDPAALITESERVLSELGQAQTLTITSGPGYELRVQRDERPWLRDVGRLETAAGATRAMVSNMPAGSLAASIIAESAEGDLFLPVAGPARAAHFQFSRGCITRIEAASGGDQLKALLAQPDGTTRQIGSIGIGLNPRLHQPLGWPLVDKHIQGAIFISFGANREQGGNEVFWPVIEFTTTAASLRAGDRVIVEGGRLVG
ncbi:aminopeptidase [Chloroflexus sp.]|uniref:aminopeptidase n=1 Tax=Chloroflexus sp. TaxID=1904827 RepID=UPI00298EE4ED|nr:aminopeptidase [Chloroflexus sp.]MDW8405768.1 aminopeptidase [Chloroflexus sp.]